MIEGIFPKYKGTACDPRPHASYGSRIEMLVRIDIQRGLHRVTYGHLSPSNRLASRELKHHSQFMASFASRGYSA
jgi:hypothetical protein